MATTRASLLALTLLLLLTGLSEARDPRGLDQLTRCVKMAEPLVKNPDNIFPLNVRDIERVCRLWDDFVTCVRDYTIDYLTASQREEFNSAIDSSIKSVNQLCVEDQEYRRSYIENAPCLKKVSINTSFCGGQYAYLADMVQGFQATDAQMCCAHHKFRECLLDKTPRECDAGGGDSRGSASQFMRSMLDRALGFLLQKCRNFVPNSRDCPRGNFGMPTSAPTNLDHFGHNHNNNNNLGGPGSSHLRPDATTSRPTPSTPTFPTTRFTWTTSPNRPSPRPTTDPSLNLAGNSLFGAESQQYRDSGSGVSPAATTIFLGLLLALRLVVLDL